MFKIRESVERFPLHLEKNWKVMDVGAAPGGITQYIASVLCPQGKNS